MEYVLNIADFMREEVFGIDDEHLFMLEMHILIELANRAEEEQSFQAQLVSTTGISSLVETPKNHNG